MGRGNEEGKYLLMQGDGLKAREGFGDGNDSEKREKIFK